MSAEGANTAALVIFINMLSKYVRLFGPTHLAVLWDAGHDMRDAAYPGYKANRKTSETPVPTAALIAEAPDSPFALAKEFLAWAGVPQAALQGWEADDLIAATARQCTGEVAIVSGDKDLLQLLGPATVQYKVPDDDPWTAERYTEHYGYPPHQAAMVHALVGDTSDGVPGIVGIGPKKAVALLEKAGWSWETLLDLLGPEKAAVASVMRSLVDLRDLEYPETLMRAYAGAPAFVPTRLQGEADRIAGDFHLRVALRDFCERYSLKSVLARLESGSLWSREDVASDHDDGLFDNFDWRGVG